MQQSSADVPASPLHYGDDNMIQFMLQGAVASSFLLCRLQGQLIMSCNELHCLFTESDTNIMHCPGWWSRVMVGLQDIGDLQGMRATQCSNRSSGAQE